MLNELFNVGETYLKELAALKSKGKLALAQTAGQTSTKPKSKRERDWGKKGRTLRERDPW